MSQKKAKQGMKQETSGDWKHQSGEGVRFNFEAKGDTLQGLLLSCQETKKFEGKVYSLHVSDGVMKGENVYFFGTAKLDKTLPGLIGQEVKIKYLGKLDLENGNTLRDFDIMSRDNTAAL